MSMSGDSRVLICVEAETSEMPPLKESVVVMSLIYCTLMYEPSPVVPVPASPVIPHQKYQLPVALGFGRYSSGTEPFIGRVTFLVYPS